MMTLCKGKLSSFLCAVYINFYLLAIVTIFLIFWLHRDSFISPKICLSYPHFQNTSLCVCVCVCVCMVVTVVFKQPSSLNSATVFLVSIQLNLNVSWDGGVTCITNYNTCKMGNVMQHGHIINIQCSLNLSTPQRTFFGIYHPPS
jgi:hypothetical protein